MILLTRNPLFRLPVTTCREAHLSETGGSSAFIKRTPELLAKQPKIQYIDALASKPKK